MSTVAEITDAIRELSPEEQVKLMLHLAAMMRANSIPIPPPRVFTVEQMQTWIDEDERDGQALRDKL